MSATTFYIIFIYLLLMFSSYSNVAMAGRPIPSSVPSTMMPTTVDYVKTNPQVLNHNKHQILDMFNVATTFCKRVSVKELVTSAPVYTTITEGDSWKHHSLSTRNTIPYRTLCWDWKKIILSMPSRKVV
ncbi:hypothetical protein PVK06_028978 [Gossypium arboreum]|uniref:Uncharacterized protein n=1 Tax=Gossypium arboreum TaxID=29729 RepID=A0ABR0P5C6_GOSAR|nr:hypothetical protein PVK06_028978 [Gossypium arboreum]